MITLINKDNIKLAILETDFEMYKKISDTFKDEKLKKLINKDVESKNMPNYFKEKIVVIALSGDQLLGYTFFEIKKLATSNNNYIEIDDLYLSNGFKDITVSSLIVESIIYIASEIGISRVQVLYNDNDHEKLNFYSKQGFQEYGMTDIKSVMSANVAALVAQKNLLPKFRQIEIDSIDYSSLKIDKKISEGRCGEIFLTKDEKVLKMFSSTSFTYLKDREETLKQLKELNIKEIILPEHLVYYNGVFTGYTMKYLPEGESVVKLKDNKFSFEQKVEIINKIECVMKRLHKNNIYICDLNPDNIFINNDNEISFIDCDAFVTKDNVFNNQVDRQYQDPINKIVSEKTDMYAFALTALQLFTGINLDDKITKEELISAYEKSKSKLPVSIKTYYDHMFNKNQRLYLSEAYDKYISDLYDPNNKEDLDKSKISGKINMIVLSLFVVVISIIFILIVIK